MEMIQTIKELQSIGFVVNKHNTTDNHFYMLNESSILHTIVSCVDAQGDDKGHFSMRLILGHHEEDELRIENYNQDSLNKIKSKIKEWESYYEN